jgi:hypothetical protein
MWHVVPLAYWHGFDILPRDLRYPAARRFSMLEANVTDSVATNGNWAAIGQYHTRSLSHAVFGSPISIQDDAG